MMSTPAAPRRKFPTPDETPDLGDASEPVSMAPAALAALNRAHEMRELGRLVEAEHYLNYAASVAHLDAAGEGMLDPDTDPTAPLRRGAALRHALEDRLVKLERLSEKTPADSEQTPGQEVINLDSMLEPAHLYRAHFRMAVKQVQQLHQAETAAAEVLTRAAASPRGRALLKTIATPADGAPMSEQEPAPQAPAPTGASIPLTTKAQVARRDEIWAKNRARLDAAKARTA